MNNKFNILKKSSTILLATVLVVGFIGISSPSSIFAQYYDDDYESEYSQYYDDNDYEKSYEKYMKDDYSKPSIRNLKINCDNSNRNPSDSNADPSNAFGLPNRDSQSDRMNGDAIPDHKGNFVFVCQNNNNNNNIVNVGNINNGTTINNNTLFIENNNAQEQQFNTPVSACNSASDSAASNTFDLANNTFTNSSLAADLSATASSTSTTTCNNVTANVGPIIANQSIADNDSGVITPNSIANDGQSSVQSLDVNSYQRVNGIEVQQQQQQRTEDSHDLTAMEKVIKLKTQWLNQLP